MADKYDELQCLAYIEGDLAPQQRAEFERALAEDPNLRALIADLQEHKRMLQAMGNETVPDEVRSGVADRLARQMLLDSPDDDTTLAVAPPKRKPRLRLRRLAIAAVVVGTASLAVTMLVENRRDPRRAERDLLAHRAIETGQAGSDTEDPGAPLPGAPLEDPLALGSSLQERSEADRGERQAGLGKELALADLPAKKHLAKKLKSENKSLTEATTRIAEEETLVARAEVDRAEPSPDAPTTTAAGSGSAVASADLVGGRSPSKPLNGPAADEAAVDGLIASSGGKPAPKSPFDETQLLVPGASAERFNAEPPLDASKPVEISPERAGVPTGAFADNRRDLEGGALGYAGQPVPDEDDDPVVVDVVAEDVEHVEQKLLTLARRYGGQSTAVDTVAGNEADGAGAYDRADALKDEPRLREVQILVGEGRLAELLDEIADDVGPQAYSTRAKSSIAVGDKTSMDGDKAPVSAEPLKQDRLPSQTETLWGLTFERAAAPLFVADDKGDPDRWHPPLKQDLWRVPAKQAVEPAPRQRKLVVFIRPQPQPKEADQPQ